MPTPGLDKFSYHQNCAMGSTGSKLVLTCVKKAMGLHATAASSSEGTPTKRQVSKRQVSKRPVSKRLKLQVYKTSGLQNVWSSKRQVFKTSGCKKPIYILYLWLVEIRRFCYSHVCRLFFILYFRGFFAIYHHNH